MRRAILILNLLIFGTLITLVVYPSLAALNESFRNGSDAATLLNYKTIFFEKRYLAAILNTIFIALLSVVTAGVLGFLLAYIFWRFTFPQKPLLAAFFLLPIGLPPLVGVFSFQFLYAESGILPQALKLLFGLNAPPFGFEGFSAVLVIHTYSFYVHFFLFGRSALSRVDYSLAEAAMTLGLNRRKTFFKVILPLLRPALVSASLIVFVLSMASFTAPLLFAPNREFLTTEIFTLKSTQEYELVSALTVILVIISAGAAILFEFYNAKERPTRKRSQRGAARESAAAPLTPLFGTLLVSIGVFVVLPLVMLVVMSFSESPPSDIFPTKWGLKNYTAFFSDARFSEPFRNSFSLAMLASVPNLLFGVATGILIAQKKILYERIASLLLILPLAIPATALAANLILTFNKPSWLTFGQTLVGTGIILPLAYFIRHLPYITRSVSSALESFDYALVEAATTLGAPYHRVILRVMLPIIISSVVSGFLFTFISAFGEFPASIMLYQATVEPVSVSIQSTFRNQSFGAASAQGVMLIIIVALLSALSSTIFKSSSSRRDIGF
jgi:iron(III) transport system permease protein